MYGDYVELGRTARLPVLPAVGVNLGGFNHRHYMGGLAQALVTGRHAIDVIAAQ